MTRTGLQRTVVLLAFVAAAAGPAGAQPNERGYITVGGTFQLTSGNFTDVIHPIDFAERATIDTRYRVESLPGLDIGGGARVWRRLSVGAAFERVSKSGRGDVSAQIPHPFFFNRARSVDGEASGLRHTETSVHVQASWRTPLTRRLTIGIAGGPSWIDVRQDLVKDVTVEQVYPYDAASFGSAVPQRHSGGHLGVNAGTAVEYALARRIGAQFGARFSRATIRLDTLDGQTVAVDGGGGRVGAGIRFRF